MVREEEIERKKEELEKELDEIESKITVLAQRRDELIEKLGLEDEIGGIEKPDEKGNDDRSDDEFEFDEKQIIVYPQESDVEQFTVPEEWRSFYSGPREYLQALREQLAYGKKDESQQFLSTEQKMQTGGIRPDCGLPLAFNQVGRQPSGPLPLPHDRDGVIMRVNTPVTLEFDPMADDVMVGSDPESEKEDEAPK